MSMYADLTWPGRPSKPARGRPAAQLRTPVTPESPTTRRQDAALGLVSPVFADLSGLPPLIIQAGTHEVLLDDAIRLAWQAATADVEVTLDVAPGASRLQAYYPILDSGRSAGQSRTARRRISPAQNASPHSFLEPGVQGVQFSASGVSWSSCVAERPGWPERGRHRDPARVGQGFRETPARGPVERLIRVDDQQRDLMPPPQLERGRVGSLAPRTILLPTNRGPRSRAVSSRR
jgi:hypothetical protein